MKQLCIIYNFAQRYRKGIYELLESEYDCYWYFGSNNSDIVGLDYSMFRNVKEIPNKYIFGKWYYQVGALRLFYKYDTFLMLGELFCLSTWLMLLLKCLFCRRKKIYLWSHGWYGRESLLKRIMKKYFFSMSDQVFLYGQHAQEVARGYGYTKSNLCVVHNSLDYKTQLSIRENVRKSNIYKDHFNNDEPVIIFIGRLTKNKRLDLLIDAMGVCKSKYNLVLVGDGEMSVYLKKKVLELKLENRVWFFGSSYDEKENAELIYNADVCVAPGNVGLTAMHSLVYGTPVITHDNYAYQMPEFEAIKPGKTGAFFKYGSSEALSDAINEWICSSADCREDIRKLCYEEIASSWTPEYQLEIFKRNIN